MSLYTEKGLLQEGSTSPGTSCALNGEQTSPGMLLALNGESVLQELLLHVFDLAMSDDCRDNLHSVYHTPTRKSPTCYVRTKPRGSVVITKPLALRRSF